jgi:hypothetical protein
MLTHHASIPTATSRSCTSVALRNVQRSVTTKPKGNMEKPDYMKVALCQAITSASVCFPELRIGQLIVNAIPVGKDLYQVSDTELFGYICDYITKFTHD